MLRWATSEGCAGNKQKALNFEWRSYSSFGKPFVASWRIVILPRVGGELKNIGRNSFHFSWATRPTFGGREFIPFKFSLLIWSVSSRRWMVFVFFPSFPLPCSSRLYLFHPVSAFLFVSGSLVIIYLGMTFWTWVDRLAWAERSNHTRGFFRSGGRGARGAQLTTYRPASRMDFTTGSMYFTSKREKKKLWERTWAPIWQILSKQIFHPIFKNIFIPGCPHHRTSTKICDLESSIIPFFSHHCFFSLNNK